MGILLVGPPAGDHERVQHHQVHARRRRHVHLRETRLLQYASALEVGGHRLFHGAHKLEVDDEVALVGADDVGRVQVNIHEANRVQPHEEREDGLQHGHRVGHLAAAEQLVQRHADGEEGHLVLVISEIFRDVPFQTLPTGNIAVAIDLVHPLDLVGLKGKPLDRALGRQLDRAVTHLDKPLPLANKLLLADVAEPAAHVHGQLQRISLAFVCRQVSRSEELLLLANELVELESPGIEGHAQHAVDAILEKRAKPKLFGDVLDRLRDLVSGLLLGEDGARVAIHENDEIGAGRRIES